MKRTKLAQTLMFSFLLVSAGALAVEVAEANFVLMPGVPANIYVQSPQNQTYNVRMLPLNFTIESYNEEHFPTVYILNSQKPVDVDTHAVSSRIVEHYVLYTLAGSAVLKDLADGTYNVTVQRYMTFRYFVINATTVIFTVDASPPEMAFPTLENKTCKTSDALLRLITNEPVSQITYSLDGKDNVTTSGNTTLTGLINGARNIQIYAWDFAGNVASENIHFAVDDPVQTAVFAGSIAGSTIVAIGLIFHFKKRKREIEPS